MRYLFLFCILACWSQTTFGQVVNPAITQEDTDILLQNTDVYYAPSAAPDTTDLPVALSNQADIYLDSNGVGNWGVYLAKAHDTLLKNWKPYGTPLGPTAVWQRFFTAKRKADGTPSDIIAGGFVYDTTIFPGFLGLIPPDTVIDTIPSGPVIVSKNEDVDFRASGEIRLEDGFHVMPGAHFHAYCDPTWGAPVFSDDFNSLDRSQWIVSDSAAGSNYGIGPNCAYDSNMTIVRDTDALDGYALDIALCKHTDSCKCYEQFTPFDTCGDSANTVPGATHKFGFSTGLLRSCPFPYTSRGDSGNLVGPRAYDHPPYGRYEVRIKVPHIPHHMNTWGNDIGGFEYDNESDNANIDKGWYHNTIYRYMLFGPFKGVFVKDTVGTVTDTEFISNAPQWGGTNNPVLLVIDGFPYEVQLKDTSHNTLVATGNNLNERWPASLVNRTDSITFYYSRSEYNIADSMTWTAYPDSFGHWSILDLGYRDSLGDTLRFSKIYQPLTVTLQAGFDTTTGHSFKKTLNCHWDSSINWPTDRGLLYIDTIDTSSKNRILASDLHGNTERHHYYVGEGVNFHYSYPPVQFGYPYDSAANLTTPYEYHTFAMELLPNEAVFLRDGNVIRRFPDRLIPNNDKHADWITTLPRFTPDVQLGQMTLDGVDSAAMSWLITHIDSTTTPGCWPVTIAGHTYSAAHTRIDYVRIYDIPADVKVSGFPH